MRSLFLIFFFSSQAFAASVNGAYVEASIEADNASDTNVIYTYKIVNGGASRDWVKTFSINVSGKSSAVASNSVSTPSNWTFMGTRIDELTWAAKDKGVPAGSSSGILKLKSDGLPGIRQYRLAPSMENSKIPFSPPQDGSALKEYLRKVEEFKRKVESRGITLAPVAPPSPFVPLAFMDVLIQNYNECVSQGMLKNKSVSEELFRKISLIRTTLENNNPVDAKNLSQNLIKQLGFQNSEKFTPEISALLKYNLQYLISQLAKK